MKPWESGKVGTLGLRLSERISKEAFKVYRNTKFRKLIELDSLEKPDQDRVFNELVVSGLVMLMLLCDAPDVSQDYFPFQFKSELKDKIKEGYIKQLKILGVEKKYLNIWNKLIDMRYEEYSNDKINAREAAMEIESKKGNLNTKTLSEVQIMLPVQTVAIGCHHHCLRSKTKGKDKLFLMIFNWLGRIYVEERAKMEGVKITFWKIFKLRIRRLVRKNNH